MTEQLDLEGSAFHQPVDIPAPALRLDPKAYWGPNPFGALPLFSFEILMIDPPWQFENWSAKGKAKSADAQYECLPDDVIKALPVGQLAAKDSIAIIWGTSPRLEMAYECARHWGFRPVTMGFWVKKTKNGKTAFGTGYRARNAGDPFVIAVAGNPDTSRSERNVIFGLAREHSRKPEASFKWCQRYLPGARRIEVFSRASRPGWSSWGNERTKFDGGA